MNVRPYADSQFEVRGVHHLLTKRTYHPMTHVSSDGVLLCGFADFAGTETDGSKGPGWAYSACDDCSWVAWEMDQEDDFDPLEEHETEEQLR